MTRRAKIRWKARWKREGYQVNTVERRNDWSFMGICNCVGLCPSAQSSLNFATFQGRIDNAVLARKIERYRHAVE